MSAAGACFFCVTGRDFFPGAVALVNSLRLHGHSESIIVLDSGMSAGQRGLIEKEATVTTTPSKLPPSALKLEAPLARPAEVVVMLDADLIVTRPLDDLIAKAADGTLVAFRNDTQRYFAEWGELLGLGHVRSDPYLTSSAVAVGGEIAEWLLPAMRRHQAKIDLDHTWLAQGSTNDPFFYFDQDVLNALAHSQLPADDVVALDARLAPIPPFSGVRIVDEHALSCDGPGDARPYLLHHASHKPWLVRMRSNVYSRLLTRLLLGSDVSLRLDPQHLPLQLRTGTAARASRTATDLLLAGPGLRRRLRGKGKVTPAWPNRSE